MMDDAFKLPWVRAYERHLASKGLIPSAALRDAFLAGWSDGENHAIDLALDRLRKVIVFGRLD